MKLMHYTFGEGPTVIILHGLFGFSDNWQTIAKTMAADFHVVLLDLRNHGRSPHDAAFDYDCMTADVIEFMNDKGISQASVVGHSLGGKVAMQLAVTEPLRINHLVVVDIAPKAYPVHHGPIIEALRSVPVNTLQSRNEADAIMAKKIPEFGVRQFLLKNLYRDEQMKLAWRMNLGAIEHHIEEVGRALDEDTFYQGPVLFIRGRRSDYISDTDEADILHHFPQARITTVENAGHWVHADQPEVVLSLLKEFLLT